MSTKNKKPGRPSEGRFLEMLSFKVDSETMADLASIQEAIASDERARGLLPNGGRAQAIRYAIRRVAALMRAGSPEGRVSYPVG